MANEVDQLMDIDPLDLTTPNIADIIAYHRKNRAAQAEGGRRAKPSRDSGPKVDISPFLTDMIAQSAAPKQSIRRR